MSHYDLLLTDIRNLVLAGDPLTDPDSFQVEVTSDPRHICSRLIEGFMDKAIDEYLNLYRMVCQNRCRIRRTFTQAIPILDALESEAQRVDAELSSVATSLRIKKKKTGRIVTLDPLTSWTRFHKLRIMTWAVQLGFETEIYLPDELGKMYWFLMQLSRQRSQLIGDIDEFTNQRKQHTQRKETVAECLSAIQWYQSLYDYTTITTLLSLALWKLYKLLTHTNIITSPKRDFAKSQLLYEARIKPFLSVINDSVPRHQDFEDAALQTDSVDTTCKDIDGSLKAAKTLLAGLKKLTPEQGRFVGTEDEWKREIKQLETTCVAIAVATSQFLRAKGKYGQDELGGVMECRPEKKYHDWWVVPMLKEKTTTTK